MRDDEAGGGAGSGQDDVTHDIAARHHDRVLMTHAHHLVSLALVALLLACTAPEPAPIQPTPVVAPVAAVAAPLAPPPSTPPAVARPVDASQPWTTLAEGVVPRALLQEVQVVSFDPPILSRALKCDAPRLLGDCNYGGTEILGFKADSVALVYAPESGHPGIWPLSSEIVGLDGKSRGRSDITRIGELEGAAYKRARLAGWKSFAERARAGYKPPEPLLWALGTTGLDEAIHAPLAFLKAPLAGWMLHIDAPSAGDVMTVQLVTPDNKVRHRLATIAVETTDRCFDADSENVMTCARPLPLGMPNIEAVALDPAGERLVVLYTLRAAGSVNSTRWALYPMPPEVPLKR